MVASSASACWRSSVSSTSSIRLGDRADDQVGRQVVDRAGQPVAQHLAVADLAQLAGEPGQLACRRAAGSVSNSGAKIRSAARSRRVATRVWCTASCGWLAELGLERLVRDGEVARGQRVALGAQVGVSTPAAVPVSRWSGLAERPVQLGGPVRGEGAALEQQAGDPVEVGGGAGRAEFHLQFAPARHRHRRALGDGSDLVVGQLEHQPAVRRDDPVGGPGGLRVTVGSSSAAPVNGRIRVAQLLRRLVVAGQRPVQLGTKARARDLEVPAGVGLAGAPAQGQPGPQQVLLGGVVVGAGQLHGPALTLAPGPAKSARSPRVKSGATSNLVSISR